MDGRNLVFVRAGPTSLHPGWLAGAGRRSWDLLISYYDAAAFAAAPNVRADGVTVEYIPGGKWEGVFETLTRPGMLDRYDYVWFPDDDVEATPQAIEAIFRIARTRELALCQPALTLDSYYSHFITLAAEGFELRYTDFVEVMAPCLSRDALACALPLFNRTKSGFGLNNVWHRLGSDNWRRAAIIDAVTVRHTRPVSTSAARVAVNGVAAEEEGRDLLQSFGVRPEIRAVAYAGVTTEGAMVNGQFRMAMRMAAAHLRNRPMPAPARHLLRMIRDHLRETPKLSPLIVPAA